MTERLWIYLAGPLFSEAERAWLDEVAARMRGEGFDCFVPHEEQLSELRELKPAEVYRIDAQGVRSANVLLAWLDGPSIDDGTACEIGMFADSLRAAIHATAASWGSSPTSVCSVIATSRRVTA